jgi:hypothetical protein
MHRQAGKPALPPKVELVALRAVAPRAAAQRLAGKSLHGRTRRTERVPSLHGPELSQRDNCHPGRNWPRCDERWNWSRCDQ